MSDRSMNEALVALTGLWREIRDENAEMVRHLKELAAAAKAYQTQCGHPQWCRYHSYERCNCTHDRLKFAIEDAESHAAKA